MRVTSSFEGTREQESSHAKRARANPPSASENASGTGPDIFAPRFVPKSLPYKRGIDGKSTAFLPSAARVRLLDIEQIGGLVSNRCDVTVRMLITVSLCEKIQWKGYIGGV
jgi:hypothetical protein